METVNPKGKFYPTKSEAILQWLDLALQDAGEGLATPNPEQILESPMLAVEIANKVARGEKPYGFSFRAIDVYAKVKSDGMASNGIEPSLILGWESQWTRGRWIRWHLSLDTQPNSCVGYFDSGAGEPSRFIGDITKGDDVPLDQYD